MGVHIFKTWELQWAYEDFLAIIWHEPVWTNMYPHKPSVLNLNCWTISLNKIANGNFTIWVFMFEPLHFNLESKHEFLLLNQQTCIWKIKLGL